MLIPRGPLSRFSGKRQVFVLVLAIVALYVLGHMFGRTSTQEPAREAQGAVYLKEVRGTGPDREYVVGIRVGETEGQHIGLIFACEQQLWTQLTENDQVKVVYRLEKGGTRTIPISVTPIRAIPPSGAQPIPGEAAALAP